MTKMKVVRFYDLEAVPHDRYPPNRVILREVGNGRSIAALDVSSFVPYITEEEIIQFLEKVIRDDEEEQIWQFLTPEEES